MSESINFTENKNTTESSEILTDTEKAYIRWGEDTKEVSGIMSEISEYQKITDISSEKKQEAFDDLMTRLKIARDIEDELSKEWIQTMSHLRSV